ncbi:GNAT family N-acetyltransferase [Streptomyces bambusae]|uniref:GNAT family N-acetyltransferase n=1 Tax=Streptomyces bambusae TaxID=1550616 RepID=A0ABS6ZAW9_9ACTN|nr:GNAT family N-acetyltransferase [Streptomyces bambusae]MBW5484886.1 GNAT family N-acetyltransferase [Streptomyces bambusae]
MVRIRVARPEEAAALTELVLRSKAHWGYGREFLERCAPELRIDAHEVGPRRVVVAEEGRSAPVGVASLEGDGARGTLGLLFVEPAAIGRGVGRALYRHAVARARELGMRRLVVDADPHAAGFYRALGAEESGGRNGLVRFEVELAPPAAWVGAWTGGRAAVHLGNVAEFNAQFGDASLDREQRAAHHYACLAAFYSPRPAALVLPRPVPAEWLDLLGRQLGWADVEVYDGLAGRGGPGLSAVVRGREALAERLTGLGLPLVPWGHTEEFARLAGLPWRAEALRYESKAEAHALFERIAAAGGHPGIVVPGQWRARTRWAAARLLAGRARAGQDTVLKSEHGVGGSGTTVVTARDVREAGGARAVLRRLPRGPLLVEEYVAGPGPDGVRDLTYDGFVDGSGRVHEVGVALMDVAGTGYRGATTGPGVVPSWAEKPMLAFGEAVGRELAAAGHRGWFDVDFVADGAGGLAPTEANLRLTGPSVAFMAGARLDEVRGGTHLVRVIDRVELGARLPGAQLAELFEATAYGCAELGAVFLPAIPTAAFARAPWIGVVVAARTPEALDAAADLVRSKARAVGEGLRE